MTSSFIFVIVHGKNAVPNKSTATSGYSHLVLLFGSGIHSVSKGFLVSRHK